MKRYNRIIIALITIILLSISIPTIIYANSAEPPGFIVIVTNPPDDLTLSLKFPDDSRKDAIELRKEKKAWETYYRFFYNMYPLKDYKLSDVVLIVESNEQSFECSLPVDTFNKYNNLLTLDLKTETLKTGQSPYRVFILVALRVILTLIIEGALFLFFGYRERRSWLAFIIINVVTQSWLNTVINGPGLGSYWMLSFIVIEILIIIVELIAFLSIVKEHKKCRTALYTIVANLVSLILGGLLITYLPV